MAQTSPDSLSRSVIPSCRDSENSLKNDRGVTGVSPVIFILKTEVGEGG